MNFNPMRAAPAYLLGLFLVVASAAFAQGQSEKNLETSGQLPRKFVDFTIQTPDHQSGVITLYVKSEGFDGGYWEGDAAAAKILGVTHGNYRRFGVFNGSLDIYLTDRHQIIAVIKGLDRISLQEGDHGNIGIAVKGVLDVDRWRPLESDYQKLDTGTDWPTVASWTCTAAL
jgi:hypothetical protein